MRRLIALSRRRVRSPSAWPHQRPGCRSQAFDQSSRVLMAFNGDMTVAGRDMADAVIVTRGTATIRGDVDTLVVHRRPGDP